MNDIKLNQMECKLTAELDGFKRVDSDSDGKIPLLIIRTGEQNTVEFTLYGDDGVSVCRGKFDPIAVMNAIDKFNPRGAW